MAGVSTATGAMSSLLGKLATLLTNEYKLLAGVRKQIEFLQRELSSMQVLLERLADMEEKLDTTAKDWRGKVRDLRYDIEDCIDRFMDRLGSGEAKRGFMKRTAHRLRTLWARHDIATQIKDLKARVIEESQRRDRYKLDESCYTPPQIVEVDPRITALYDDVSGLVAIDGPVKDIASLLMDEKEMQLKVVAIVGSIRRTGEDDPSHGENLLKDILSQIDKDAYGECQSEGWRFQQLIRKIKQILTGKRIFYSDDPCPADLEEVATRILKKCGGLPLAIITFASLLAGKAHDKDEWERLQDSIGIGSLLEKDGNLKIRRLSMQSCGGKCNGTVCAITETKSHVHSLTMFQRGEQKINIVGFHALRVLGLEGYEWLENKHLKNIGSSPQLRFLRIHSNKITEIPREIGKLQHLETLDLNGCMSGLRLPSTMVHLHKLVRLFVNPSDWLPADAFRGMQALEVLQGENIWGTGNPMRFAEELGHLTKLRRLSIVPTMVCKEYAIRGRIIELLVLSVRELGKCNLRDLNTNREICWHLFRDPYCTYPYLQVLRIETIVEEVPKGVGSLKNLTNLYLKVAEFDKELEVTSVVKGKLMIGADGFNLLTEFFFAYLLLHSIEPTDGLQLTFSLGAVPALRQLHLQLKPMVVMYEFFANLGIEHFSGLTHLQVEIDCCRAAPGQVETMESYIERAIELHPGHEIHVSRISERYMFKDDMQWEEAIAKDRKEREELKIYIAKIQEEERTRAE
ncbi:disease resistance protein Pik-2-like [Aegilops tauschii subsp. strangulata]|uniref:Putative disease resistance RPP8-like protein 4 n=1 Tax=Aegilops tauschii TaxID=37682 RepID=M8C1G4_AEGTA